MRCTVKAITLIKPYVKKDGKKFMGGFSIVAQDYPMGPVITVFSKQKVEEGENIYLSPVTKLDGSIFYRLMTPDEIDLEKAEFVKA